MLRRFNKLTVRSRIIIVTAFIALVVAIVIGILYGTGKFAKNTAPTVSKPTVTTTSQKSTKSNTVDPAKDIDSAATPNTKSCQNVACPMDMCPDGKSRRKIGDECCACDLVPDNTKTTTDTADPAATVTTTPQSPTVQTPQNSTGPEVNDGVTTPAGYKYLFDGCPRGAASKYEFNGHNLTVSQCAMKCTADTGCIAFETNGCTKSPNCGGACFLFYGNVTAQNPITDGGCGGNGTKKAYAKVI